MSKQIEAPTLRDWLDAHEPVTVVDIRTDDDYAQWAIPGSLHVNAYEALRNGESGALADLTLPIDRPVVTVCNAGKVSQTAADVLAKRGFDARSLAGGMKAWSLAWNAAEVVSRTLQCRSCRFAVPGRAISRTSLAQGATRR